MTPEEKRAVFDVLVEECGAHPSLWEQFKHHWPQCGEFRFQGSFGFGGKVYVDDLPGRPPWVDCYREDETPARRAAITRANTRLTELKAGARR